MNLNFELRPEIATRMRQSIELAQLQRWEKKPFKELEKEGQGEVLINLKRAEPSKGGRNLEADYKSCLRPSIMHLAEAKNDQPYLPATIVLEDLSQSGVAKGASLSGKRRLLKKDFYLQSYLRFLDIRLEIVPLLFALYMPVAQLPSTHEHYPHLAVDPKLRHGEQSANDYRRISLLQWRDVCWWRERARRDPHLITIFLVESPGIGAFPKIPYQEAADIPIPLEMDGTDRGASVVYNFIYDPETRENTFLEVIEKNRLVRERVGDLRFQIDSGTSGWESAIDSDVCWTVAGTGGREVKISDLPLEQREAFRKFVINASASPKAITRSDKEFKFRLDSFFREGLITSPTMSAYVRFMQQRIKFDSDHFWFTENPYFSRVKYYDLGYQLDSLAVRLHPEIVDPILSPYIQNHGLNGEVFG